MNKFYSGFSNYKELNQKNREIAAEKEISKWGDAAAVFDKYRQEWVRADREDYLPPSPLHVDIELSDACNLKCEMCAHGLGTVKNCGLMKRDLIKHIIDQCVKNQVFSVKFNWRGEPILNKDLPWAVAYAKKEGILETQINTNGNIFSGNSNILIDCAKNGIDRIIFSVDGFSASTYENIRRGGSYETLLKSIGHLLEWKIKKASVKPFVRVQMVRTINNSYEVDGFIAYWQKHVDDVRISDVMDRGQGKDLTVADQVAVGRRRCPQPFQRLTIGRNGKVSPCCGDWDQAFVIGDITKESMASVWTNERMTTMRDIQNKCEHNKIKVCSNCYVKESYLWEAL